eukprot:TRINITY_DN3425_c0_g1_i1.p3 TRINITY_DN3425_c0_g1~~TRINITY_DN3425_c0_g1_i1.p3  ORF type:complete len:112 (+),score=37.32 TRINITY_DN3425_c0_g1_i1:78-413(+)
MNVSLDQRLKALSIEKIYKLNEVKELEDSERGIDLPYAGKTIPKERNYPMQIPKALMDEIISSCEEASTQQSDKATERLQLCKLGQSKAWRQLQQEIYGEESGATYRPKVG